MARAAPMPAWPRDLRLRVRIGRLREHEVLDYRDRHRSAAHDGGQAARACGEHP
jgi:hypothetical protein